MTTRGTEPKPKIMIVEDEIITAEHLAVLVESVGYEVCANITSGEKAVEVVKQVRPDLVLMDIVLKGEIDGIEAAERIRAIRAVPIVFLSGHADRIIAKRDSLTGPFGYVLKPIQEKQLLVAIEMAMHLARVEAERTAAQEALVASEQKYRNLVENSSDGIWIVQDTLVRFANVQMALILGYSVEELLGKSFLTFVHLDDLPKIKRNYERLIAGFDHRQQYELILMHKNGQKIEAEFNISRTEFEGRSAGIVLTRDITLKKRAERALRRSEKNFYMIFQASPMAVAITGFEDGRIMEVNKSFERVSSYSRDAVLGRTPEELGFWVDPEDFAGFSQKLEAYGSAREFDARFRTKTGEIRHGQWSLELMEMENKPALICLMTDVTARKQAEQKLAAQKGKLEELVRKRTGELETANQKLEKEIREREKAEAEIRKSEEKFRNVVQASPLGIQLFKLEDDGRLVFQDANPAADNILGVDNKNFIGRTLEEIFPDLIDTEIPERYRLAAALGQSFETELAVGGQQEIAGVFEIKAFQTSPGKMVVMFSDITERKKVQERLRLKGAELSLTEERERRRIAMELNDHIGQCLKISKARLTSLGQSLSQTDQEKTVEEIIALIDRMANETKILTLELSPPILYESGFKAALAWLVEQTEKKHNLPIEFIEENQVGPVAEDTGVILFRSVRELLINVIKHAGASKARVTVGKDEGFLKLEVIDDGRGFNPDDAGENPARPRGLGLDGLRERIVSINGRLEVESTPGQGAAIRIWVPSG